MEKKLLYLKINDQDNVAVLLDPAAPDDLAFGTAAGQPAIAALQDIPAGHKIALADIPRGGEIIRYGVVLGYARRPVRRGAWIDDQVIELPPLPSLDSLPDAADHTTAGHTTCPPARSASPARSFLGFRNESGYAGTRNLLGILTTVQCVSGVVNAAVERIRRDILPRYPNVDQVVPLNHAYGCGVAIDAPEARVPIRTLANLVRHPNFGGEVLIVGLGCEKLTPDRLLDRPDDESVLILQDCRGYEAMIQAIILKAEQKLVILNRRSRQELSLEQLIIGIQCGGSDAFSGLTANPAVGYAVDLLVQAGATVLFSEVSEVRDAVPLLAARVADRETGQALVREMRWFDQYLADGGVDRSANPSPGNKKGGLSNIIEKAMGSVVKSGASPIVEVVGAGQRPSKKGLIFAATPASDFICGTLQLASGITLQVFTTGRGTPYNLSAAPVIKVSTNSRLAGLWPDLIDIDAGGIASGERSIAGVGRDIFQMVLDTASGRIKPCAEKLALTNDLCLFDPSPVT